MRVKKLFFTCIFLAISINSIACSCPSLKIVNAFSNLDFIGIIEFESVKRIEKSYGLYQTKIK